MQTLERDGSTDAALDLRNLLLDNLRTGYWKAGQKLPTERHLSDSFQIARSTVRRVLRELKQKGLIRQSVGSGTFVIDTIDSLLESECAPLPESLSTSPAELMEARLAFEPPLVELVCKHATATDFLAMEECLDKSEMSDSLEQFEYWDGALHQKIAAATHNNFVQEVFNAMTRVRSTNEWGALKRRSVTAERCGEYQHQHRSLVAALKDRDIERAQEATLAHLLYVRKNLLGR